MSELSFDGRFNVDKSDESSAPLAPTADRIGEEVVYNNFEVCMSMVESGQLTFEEAMAAFKSGEIPVARMDALSTIAIEST